MGDFFDLAFPKLNLLLFFLIGSGPLASGVNRGLLLFPGLPNQLINRPLLFSGRDFASFGSSLDGGNAIFQSLFLSPVLFDQVLTVGDRFLFSGLDRLAEIIGGFLVLFLAGFLLIKLALDFGIVHAHEDFDGHQSAPAYRRSANVGT